MKCAGPTDQIAGMVWIISLHIRSMWETTVMHKQVSGCTVNFGPNFWNLRPESPPPPPFPENFRFGMTKVYSGIPPISENFRFGLTKVYSGIPPPHFGKLQIWVDQSLLRNTPHFGKLQIWVDQSLLQNTPPFRKTSDLGWPKFTPEYPPPFRKTSDLGWPKFTPEYPPISENFRFGLTKVYSGIPPPHFGKLQIWDDQSLLRNTPPILENFRFGLTKVYSGIPPPPPPECRELLHVETLSNPDKYSLLWLRKMDLVLNCWVKLLKASERFYITYQISSHRNHFKDEYAWRQHDIWEILLSVKWWTCLSVCFLGN